MERFKVFISSVQKEFEEERLALYRHFHNDPLLSTYFDAILFEQLPAASRPPNQVYLHEVARANIYLGLLGAEYGYEDENGISPTEHEYDAAVKSSLERWVYIKGASKLERHPKELAFIQKVGDDVTRKRFLSLEELTIEVSRACLAFLQQKGVLSHQSFDSSLHPTATLDDLDPEKIQSFLQSARAKRGFPLAIDSQGEKMRPLPWIPSRETDP